MNLSPLPRNIPYYCLPVLNDALQFVVSYVWVSYVVYRSASQGPAVSHRCKCQRQNLLTRDELNSVVAVRVLNFGGDKQMKIQTLL